MVALHRNRIDATRCINRRIAQIKPSPGTKVEESAILFSWLGGEGKSKWLSSWALSSLHVPYCEQGFFPTCC